MKQDHYLDPYRQSHLRHGSAFEVTLWASPKSQQRRFEVFSHMIYLPGKRLLDAGCSRGDLADWLLRQDLQFEHYVGVDALEEVVQYARSRNLPRCEFLCEDFLKDAAVLVHGNPQIVIVSGSLNTMSDQQVERVLENTWRAAGEALAFNFLSDRCDPQAPMQSGPARRLNAMRLLDWALSKTSQVAYRQDYFRHGHDATIVMRKNS